MEKEPNSRTKMGPARPSQSTIILALTGLAIVAVVALPIAPRREMGESPADDARSTYLTLMAQMAAQDQQSTEPVFSDSADATRRAGRLDRDLFAPAPRRSSGANAPGKAGESGAQTPAAARMRWRPPNLGGIYIDGDQARAIIDGRVVAVGDKIREFQVIEIQANGVLLKRGEQVEKLVLGGGR